MAVKVTEVQLVALVVMIVFVVFAEPATTPNGRLFICAAERTLLSVKVEFGVAITKARPLLNLEVKHQ